MKKSYGSNAVVGQSGGPTAAINASLAGVISAALEKLMKNKQHICLVTEGNTVTGILTLEDIFEEMVGEIEDEYDFFLAYIRPFGDGLIASATAKMSDDDFDINQIVE